MLLLWLLLHDFFGLLDDVEFCGSDEVAGGVGLVGDDFDSGKLILLLLLFLGLVDRKQYILVKPSLH